MNKNLFRIIFNKRRGQLMAVAETSSSQGKGSIGESVASGHSSIVENETVGISALSFAVLCALGAVLWALPTPNAHAQVVAYRNAPSNQQPTVLQTANGVPQVDIQTPSAAGVSRNVYSQFDVQRNGVILNNSHANVQTQQGGWVQGNPWLATGSARVILNEVNSSNPSYLNGYVEVAGQRAEVVIANPSGISVNGGGFINTSKATLTTGTPIVNGGSLDGYRVQGGNISINGNGLDLSTTDYSAILARAVQVNAGIWANELKVVTGANQIDSSSLAANTIPVTTTIAGTGAVPSFALDVAQIGGMYAGKIHLIGTEQGLGVRSAGTIGSTGGDLVLQNNGWLTTTGTLQASANLQITTQGNVTNSGVIAAQGNITLIGSSVDLSGSQTSAKNVGITTAGNLNTANATVVASLNLTVSSADFNNAGGTLAASQSANFQTNALNNDAGLIQVGGDLVINTHDQTLTNTNAANYTSSNAALNGKGGIAAQGTTTLTTGDLNNDAGYLGSKGVLTATSANISNQNGQIQGLDHLTLTAGNGSTTGAINNTSGLIRSAATASLNAGEVNNSSTSGTNQGLEGQDVSIATAKLNNNTGAIRANNNVSVTSAGTVDNTSGLISVGNAFALQDTQAQANRTLAITNKDGTLIADKTLTVAASSLGGDGKVLSKNDLSVTLNTDFSNSGQVIANHNATLTTSGNVSNSGKLQAGNTLNLTANNIDNTASGEITANTTQVNASNTLSNRGLIDGVDTQVNTGTVNNIGTGRIYGDHLSIAAVNLTNNTETIGGVTKAGTLAARDLLDLGISGTLTNREHALIYSVGNMAIGGALDANRQATGLASTVNNNSATIEAGRNLNLSSATLNNTNQHYTSSEYQVAGPTTKNLTVGQYHVDHQTTTYDTVINEYETKVDSSDPAQILAGGNMQLKGQNLTNDKSKIIAGGSLTGDLGNLNNIQAMGEHRVTESGTITLTTHHWEGGWRGRGNYWTDDTTAYNPPDVVTSITLPVTYALQNTAPTATGNQVAARTQVTVSGGTSAAGSASARSTVVYQPTLSTSSLYKNNPSLTASYLVETDARFTNNKLWLGSDFMTQSLSLDPSVTQKRLGDGFYEQKLIREQVAELTGKRFLGNYTSDEQEYKALMNSAITFAQKYNLRPGIALTAQQVAQLTSDIVWLVEQTVSLPDGSSQKVLVPQVYVKVQPGDLDGSGTLLSGKDVNLNLSGDLTNSGTIYGRNIVNLTAENINNLGGRMGGNDVSVAARQDLNNMGGSISGVNNLSATAGRDLNIQTTTQSTQTAMGSRTAIDRVAGLYVSGANGTLVASAGRDLNIVAGVVSNAGSGATSLDAGNNFTLSSVKTSDQLDVVWNANNYNKSSSSSDVGSAITGGGNTTLQAGQTLKATAASVQAAGALNVNATDVSIQSGQATQASDQARQTTNKGFLSSTTITTRDTSSSTTAVSSSFGGATVAITASKDIRILGSNVVSDNATKLTAGGNVNIEAAQNTSSSSSYRNETSSGLMSGGGLSISYGTRTQSNDGKDTTTTAAASTVGSVGGNVTITAGNQYKQVGSDVLTPTGDINITAKTVDIQEARETSKQSTEQKFEQSGLTLAVTSTVLSTLENAQSQIKATTQTSDNRMKALGTASAAANVKLAVDALKAGQGDANGMVKTGAEGADGSPEVAQANAADKAGGIQVSLSYGQSSSQSNSSATSDTARGSTVKAGGTVSIKATGDGQNSNLTVQGSDVSGKTVNLEADNQVNLLAAQNTSSQTSSSSNSSASVGIAAQLGNGGGGIGFTGSVSKGSGSGNGTETTYTNTHVAGAENVNIQSGADTTLKGATVEGKQITATVGGNLNIESLQDTATYAEQNKQVDASGMIGAGGSGSVNYAKSNINSNYASVTEQSGIKAGDGGFTVNVQGNTDLKGGAITSTRAAIDNNKNSFQTGGTLTTSDIQNSASYEAKSVSVSIGTGAMPGQGLSAGLSGAGMGKDSGSTSSITTAGISGIAGDTAKRTGDNAQGIGKIFDADKVRQEIQAQTKITQEFGKQASAAIASYSTTQKQTLQDQIKKASDADKAALQKQLDDVKNEERVLNILVGAVTGFGQTAVTKESLAAAADEMRALMVKDSSTFAGVVDSTGKKLSNVSGASEGMNGDGVKLGGTRVDLDLLCGPSNDRCAIQKDASNNPILDDKGIPKLAFNSDGQVVFTGGESKQTLDEFLATPDGKKMEGSTGGVQGYKGTLFGKPYEVGSWQDKLIESFAGTHDMIGGKLSGLYDEQGNIKRGMSAAERSAYDDVVTRVALLPSAPFAAAQGLPPEVWKAISVLLGAAK